MVAILSSGSSFAQSRMHHKTAKAVAGCPTVPARHHYVRHHAKKPVMLERTIYVDDRSSTATVDLNKGEVYVNDSLVFKLKNPRYEQDRIVISYIVPPATPVAMDISKDNSYTANKQGRPLLGVVTCNYCDKGAIVEDIIPCGPADKAGLDPGDVITRINDKDINNKEDLVEAIGSNNVGDNVTITYMHYGRTETTTAELGEKEKVENCNCAEKEPYSSCNGCYSRSGRW